MIYSFGANNYFSFKDGFEVTLEFNSKVPKSVSRSKKASSILGIKGANASGKTNILKCLQFLAGMATRSFKYDPDDELPLEGFFRSGKPTDFFIEFLESEMVYRYELTCTKTEILREAIYKKISRKTRILERVKNTLKYRTNEISEIDVMTLRKNVSIIDTASHYQLNNIGEDLSNVYNFFKNFFGNVSGLGFVSDDTLYDESATSKRYMDNPEALNFATDMIKSADLGIEKIVIHKSKKENGEDWYFPIFHHDVECDEDTPNWLTYWAESDGTTALYRRLFLYWSALKTGGVLIMDEFDTQYHPDLLPKILDLFISPESNPLNAQFLFTSHNLEIMDYLGKYRTYLVSKEKNESFCYRLDEIPGDIVRNDRSISALYRDGKLGGVPKI